MLQVLNNQTPWRVVRDPEGTLGVHSWFHTIQGEGPFAGRPAFFIRLAGCNLQCPGCDTEYTSHATVFTPASLYSLVRKESPVTGDEVIVITGGEPFRQNLEPFVRLLSSREPGRLIQIETNGVLYPGNDFPFRYVTIVCSPKTGKVHPSLAYQVDAYKYVLEAGDVAEDGLPIHALQHPLGSAPHVARPPEGWNGPIYLQPMDAKNEADNRRNIQAVVDSVMTHKRYIMGVQMHKLTGLP